jgi:hypothetical protein
MPSALSSLRYVRCAGAVPGSVYIAPGPIVAVSYNGQLLRNNVLYTQALGIITLRFTTEPGDQIYALCIA